MRRLKNSPAGTHFLLWMALIQLTYCIKVNNGCYSCRILNYRLSETILIVFDKTFAHGCSLILDWLNVTNDFIFSIRKACFFVNFWPTIKSNCRLRSGKSNVLSAAYIFLIPFNCWCSLWHFHQNKKMFNN